MNENAIPKRLSAILDYFSITQKELAQRSGLTETSLSRYINGNRIPTVSAIISITKATGVSPSWILGFGPDNEIFQIF